MTDKPILVFGATGLQGGAVARALIADQWPVRALVRNPDSGPARALSDLGVTLFKGDFDDQAAIRRAMTGAYGVFSVQPSSGQGEVHGVTDEQEEAWGRFIADEAVRLGVRHLVYSSVLSAGREPLDLPHFDTKTRIENHIRSLDLPATIVRPPSFMELLLSLGAGLKSGQYRFLLKPEQSIQIIATSDIGRIVAKVFARPDDYIGTAFEIAAQTISGREIGEVFTKSVGKPVHYDRFDQAFIEANPLIARLVHLVDRGRFPPLANVPELEARFGPLMRFDDWLGGEGRPLLENLIS